MNYVCHSGGALGSDLEWELQGEHYGVKTIAYSFKGHNSKSKNLLVLTDEQLEEGSQAVNRANRTLKRNINYISPYVKALLSRDWFQVKNSDAVFAIIKGLVTKEIVIGGTGWAVQMAIDCDKPVFIYHQHPMDNGWSRYMPVAGFEKLRGEIPKLTENFAGIGTREINEFGKSAIKSIYSLL